MVDTTGMPLIRLHYWAGARAAAGVEEDQLEAESVQAALDLACRDRDAHFARVLGLSTILIEGVAAHPAALRAPRTEPVLAEVLPPFAGGSRVAAKAQGRAGRGSPSQCAAYRILDGGPTY